ncbi:MAG: hypothetical protein WBA68_06095 [Alteraurantiacibacter sp.]
MSRRLVALAVSIVGLGMAGGAAAQDIYGPTSEDEFPKSDPDPVTAGEPCDVEQEGEDVILVCRELDEEERYRDPLPPPVASDRIIMPGFNDPPCWVTKDKAVCIRMGWAPEPAIMVDTTAFPEELSREDKAAVIRAESEAPREVPVLTGERVPIDLSDDEEPA